jgi:hypothetical protein
LWPADAQAQRRGPRIAHRPAVVRVSRLAPAPFFYYGYYRQYDPFFTFSSFYPWWPYPPGFYQPYGPRFVDHTSAVRLQITPSDTEVYVDGYFAGHVDDYDGVFQRLRVAPGQHELVLYLDGFRTVRQSVYLQPGSTHKIRHTMERLTPGEAAEPRPAPVAQAPAAPGPPLPPAPPPPPGPRAPEAYRFGSIAIRVQPADAEVFIDGEPWRGAGDRLVVQVAEGPHRVEIRKDGYERFETDVRVRGGETTTLNVSLSAVMR